MMKPVTALMIAIVLAVLTACAEKLTVPELLARAETAISNGEFRAADLDLRTALQQEPDNHRGRLLLASIKLWFQKPNEAIDELERAIARDANAEALTELAVAHIRAQKIDEFFALVESGRFTGVESHSLFLSQLGLAELARGNEEAARGALSAATEQETADIRVPLAQIDFDAATGVPDAELRGRLQALLNDQWPDYLVLERLAILEARNEELEAAIAAAEKAVSLNPNLYGSRVRLGNLQLRAGDLDAAEATIGRALKISATNPGANLIDAQIKYRQGNYPEAVTATNAVLALLPKNPSALQVAALANLANNNLELARSQLTTLTSISSTETQPLLQLGTVQAALGEQEAAEAAVREYLEREPSSARGLRLLALILSTKGMHDESATTLAQALELEPESLTTKVLLGSELAKAGDYDAAQSLLLEAKDEDPSSVFARSTLISTYLASGSPQNATAEATQFADTYAENVGAQLVAAGTMRTLRENDTAEDYYRKAIALDGKQVEARIGLATIANEERRYSDALRQYATIEDIEGSSAPLLLSMAAVYEATGDLDMMAATLERSANEFPESSDAPIALARYLISEQEYSEAIAILSSMDLNAASKEPAVQNMLGSALFMLGEYRMAADRAKAQQRLTPEDANAYMLAYRAERALGNIDRSLDALRKAASFSSDNGILDLLVSELIKLQRIDEAQSTIDEASTDSLPVSLRSVMQGRIYLADQKPKDAEIAVLGTHQTDPSAGSATLLAQAYWMQGARDEAIGVLNDWLASTPGSASALTLRADYLTQTGQMALAVDSLEALQKLRPNSISVLNNLAWVSVKVDPGAGLEWAQRAYELAPSSAQISDTYAMALLANDSVDEALELTQQNLTGNPGDPNMILSHSKALAKAGQTAEARSLVASVLKVEGIAQEAEALYEKLQ